MQFSASLWRRIVLAVVLAIAVSAFVSCSSGNAGRGPGYLGTFRMGERVQAPPLVYNVLEAEWKTELREGGRTPKHRFLFVRITATNSGGSTVHVPGLQLESSDGKTTYPEETENMEGVRDWLGMLRSIEPAQTENGFVVFDAPMGAYNLLLSDGGDLEKERFAIVEIPVILE